MTSLNTIIEEEKKEFDRRIDSENYETEEDGYGSLKTGSDTLLGERWYPESEYEIDEEKVKDFLATAMQRAYEAGEKKARADWLRSEIEKLEGMEKDFEVQSDGQYHFGENQKVIGFNQALTSIITRYKEELLELENGK